MFVTSGYTTCQNTASFSIHMKKNMKNVENCTHKELKRRIAGAKK